MTNAALVLVASLCLIVALIQSWLIVGALIAPQGPVGRRFPSVKELIRSHIDYLMMAQFLFIFYGLFRFFAISVPVWLVAIMGFGSFFNPFAFFLRSMNPSWIEAPPRPYLILLNISCVSTTLGYGITAVWLAVAAVKAA